MPTISITFDDGYADNFVNLRAVSEVTGVPIAYFIATEHITRGNEFAHDLRSGERETAPNTWEQIEVLKKFGYDIGSHTRTHGDCGATDKEFLHNEIVSSWARHREEAWSDETLFLPVRDAEQYLARGPRAGVRHLRECVLGLRRRESLV